MAKDPEHRIVGSGPAAHAGAAAADYWTEERRAAAKPVPLPQVSEQGAADRDEDTTTTSLGTEAGHLDPHRGPDQSEDEDAGEKRRLDAGGNPVASPLSYPYTTCGKLFFTQGGGDFAGSAAVVAPNILLTAGHCVNNGGWSTNVAFYPSYPSRGSSDPAYQFVYSYEAAWTAWTEHGDRAFDYGMIWIDNNPGQAVGWLGLLWNAATSGRTWDAVGYPATPNPPFGGEVMDEAIGTVQSSGTSGTIGLSNDNMEHGSSGGPWITDFNGSPREYANGLQSFHINDGDFVEYGPYFTADVKNLYDWISDPAHR